MIEWFNQSLFLAFYRGKLSCSEASEQCKIIGGHLPVFTSKRDLDKLLAFFKITNYLKHEDHVEPIFQMYIGLRHYSNKVSCTKHFLCPLNVHQIPHLPDLQNKTYDSFVFSL